MLWSCLLEKVNNRLVYIINMTKKKLITWLTAIYIVLLTTLCLVQLSVPAPDVPVIGFDKIVHFCFYLGLNTLLVSTIIAHKCTVETKQIVATTISSIAYGVAIEFVQQQVGRDFDIYDIAANSLGAITAAFIFCNSKIKVLIKTYLQR